MNNFYEKIGEPVTNIADAVTKSYPSNEDLELAGLTEDGAVVNDALALKRNRNILAGFLTLVLGGLALVVIFLCFTKMGAKVRKKLKLKVSGVARATKRRVKKRVSTYRKKRAYRKKK